MSGPFGQGPFGDGGIPDLAAMFESMGRMMRLGAVSGSVDWQAARETATGAMPTSTAPISGHTQAVSQAQSLADLWLDQVTTLSAPGTTVRATTARGWLDATFSSWQSFVEPVADGVATAMSSLLPSADSPTAVPAELLDALPEEMRDQVSAMLSSPDFAAMTQQVSALANSMGASMFGTQFGKALADMSIHLCSASDVGIPLTSEPLIMVSNLESMANDLSVPVSDVVLFATLRELAHQRLLSTDHPICSIFVPTIAKATKQEIVDSQSGVSSPVVSAVVTSAGSI